MADDPHNTSDISDHAEPSAAAAAAKEDAETTAARRELKQTSISDKAGHGAVQLSQDEQGDKSASDDDAPRDNKKGSARQKTPDVDVRAAREEVLKEQVSSPKKKRGRDELEENREGASAPLGEGASDRSAGAAAAQSRTDRSEPEKKRPRDRQASASAARNRNEEVVSINPRPGGRPPRLLPRELDGD